MDVSLSYRLEGEGSGTCAEGEAHARLDTETLAILPEFGEAVYLSLRDITEISDADYRVRIGLTSREVLTLSHLGYKYEDFLRVLFRLRNEMVLSDMLMEEGLKKSAVRARFSFRVGEGDDDEKTGECEVRLYETGLVLIPETEEIIRIPYCYLSKIGKEGDALVLDTEFGERLTLSGMGRQFDPTARVLSDSINALSLTVQESLRELVPDADPLSVRRVAGLMKEGRAARRRDVDAAAPELWRKLEGRLKGLGSAPEYDFLVSLAQKDRICIGLKRGLMGDLTGDYIWFLVPIYDVESETPGNVVAMESITGEGGSSATYFFRLTSRLDYPGYRDLDELHRVADAFFTTINRCMLAVNFRREPVYLPEERLLEPRYRRYRIAVSRIPELRILREHFVGRVIHRSVEQWTADVTRLLEFNAAARDDGARWARNTPEGGE